MNSTEDNPVPTASDRRGKNLKPVTDEELSSGGEISIPAYLGHFEGHPHLLIDVRNQNELGTDGRLAGSFHLPLADLLAGAELPANPGGLPLIIHCASGKRSLRASIFLADREPGKVYSLAGGFNLWKEMKLPIVEPEPNPETEGLSAAELRRYNRQMLLPELGTAGQRKLKASRVILVGAGGLGSPLALYLAAAGVGRLDIIDGDSLDVSNLHRQIAHSSERVGMNKAESVRQTLGALNPEIEVVAHSQRLGEANLEEIFDLENHPIDVVVDGSDNFEIRYLLNRYCVAQGLPLVSGSIVSWEGQVSVFNYGGGPCYSCVFPVPPPDEMAPACEVNGVVGSLPGVIATLQATEVIKIIIGAGAVLANALVLYDALAAEFLRLKTSRNPRCEICGTP